MHHRMRLGSLSIPKSGIFAALAAAALIVASLVSTVAFAKSSHHQHHRAHRSATHGLPAVTISPLAGTPTVSPHAQISFLGVPAKDLTHVVVIGKRSGRHSGKLRSYDSAAGASFIPSKPFTPGEHVTVRATERVGTRHRSISTSFKVAYVAHLKYGSFKPVEGTEADIQHFHSTSIEPPTVTVNQPAGSASAPGYLMATPALGPGEPGPMIFESSGRLVWFQSLRAGWDATDLKVKPYEGHNDLVWWQGRIVNYGFGLGEDVIANSSYQVVARIKGGNGVSADLHDVQLLGNGAALITAYEPVHANLTSVKGGSKHGIALDAIMQEIDIKTGLVMWEWHSIGHVPYTESHSPAPQKASMPYDYFHINSVQALKNGDFLISSRNTWAAYELSSRNGHIAWQLGGHRSTFKLGKHVRFAWQHHVRMLPNGEITIFDDEGAPQVGPHARGEILRIDKKTKTANLVGVGTLVREPEPLQTGSQGDVQPLSNGNWMVGWGGLPNFTEFNGEGKVVYDAQFPEGENSYRVYRFEWEGMPSTPPDVAASTSGSTTTVYASWNGATNVASWQVLAGPSATQLSAVGSPTAVSGFETAISTPAAAYVEVQALDSEGKVLGTSEAIAPVAG